MGSRRVRFKQVDVFSDVPFKGNALAVVFDADGLDADEMLAIARWTNLSETTFLVEPTDPAADYFVRIFTPAGELPFAGHPTLGTAHALVESGYVARTAGRLVQQCGVGLVEIEERSPGVRAFAAPPARITPLPQSEFEALRQALAIGDDEIDFTRVPPSAIDNGVRWLAVGLASPERCVTLKLDPSALSHIVQRAGMKGLMLYAPHPPGGPASYEMRCIVMDGDLSVYEDPVTGSANAGLASLLSSRDARPGDHYTVRQGVAIGRAGRVLVDYDDARGKIWIGGASTTVVDGTISVP